MCEMCGAGGELCKYESMFSQSNYSVSSNSSSIINYQSNMSTWYQ